ncbi:hypothetical protein [Embleya scabrispora]|uniref:hypothetical protein n=1 Tax=Embleya scabrispora TaxID=159449 RepID=UPI001F466E6C|nr:hypothetical protein [Embleya scabrispora]
MDGTKAREQRTVGLALDAPELGLPVNPSGAEPLPDLSDHEGPVPFAFRFLAPVTGTGGILLTDVGYERTRRRACTKASRPGCT